MKIKELKAYSLAEICITMMLIAFLFLVTFFNIPNLLPDPNKAGFKKGYASLETAIASLLANHDIYQEDKGFKDTGKITFEGTGIVLGKASNDAKFRDAIKYSMVVVKDNITCQVNNTTINTCFKTQDGVVYGIPNTNFNNPVNIAFYPTWEDGYTFEEKGFTITISNFGEISLANNTKAKHKYIEEYLTSTTIKTTEYPESK